MTPPTVFHVTHWKAGSTWVREVLQAAVPDRIVPVKTDMSHVTHDPIVPAGVYTPVYLPRPRFQEAVGQTDHRLFVVIRDLRDTLVSWYFSLRYSHGSNSFVDQLRAQLQSLSVEEGLLLLIEGRLSDIAWIQQSWLESDAMILRYEEMLADEQRAFERIFRHCQLDVPAERRRSIVEQCSFERRTGRPRGQEDATKHRRKGVAGDWRNHFTPRVAAAFQARFAEALVASGYEASAS